MHVYFVSLVFWYKKAKQYNGFYGMFFLYFFTFQGTKRENKQIKKLWKNQYEKTKLEYKIWWSIYFGVEKEN